MICSQSSDISAKTIFCKMRRLTCRHSLQTSMVKNRSEEFEESIKRTLYIQTVFLSLKAEQARKEQKADTFAKVTAIWKQTNEMRDQLLETHKYVNSLENLLQTIDILENQKTNLEKYLEIRSKVDPLFNRLSELIDSKKQLLNINNCSEEDFNQIKNLLESCPNSERLESAAKATVGIKNAEQLVREIKFMEIELKELHNSFDKCVKELDKYESIESQDSQKFKS